MAKTHELLKQRRFLPYFMTQALGAFNDNVYKNTLLILVAFAAPGTLSMSSNLFINMAAGVFILPFFLFSAMAGELADKYEKSSLIRKVKLAEIVIMSLAAAAFVTESYTVLLLLLFLMGTQSAFFGPVKYALLPQQLKTNELVPGNALVEMGTFLAILLGTLIAGVIANQAGANEIAAVSVVVLAVLGYLASRAIPEAPAGNPNLKFRVRPVRQMKTTLDIARKDLIIFQAIMGISWFWFLGASYLTQFPNFTKLHLGGNEAAVSFLLGLFSIGIAVGSLLCDRLSGHKIEPGIVPLGSFGITVFGLDLMFSVPDAPVVVESFTQFVSQPELWRSFFDLTMLGVSGGLFIVPLYAIMQQRADEKERSQVIAANNIYNALFMVGSAVMGIVLLGIAELSIPQFFGILSALNLLVAVYIFRQIPLFTLRFLIWILCRVMYRIKCHNLHHIPEKGGALLVCNHVSFVDALLLLGASRRPIRFVMDESYYHIRGLQYFFHVARVIPINTTGGAIRKALESVRLELEMGQLVCIFPEGTLSPDGEVGPFMRGMDVILRRTPVPVVPMALRGLWGSFFSRERGRAITKMPKRFWSRIEIVAGEPVQPKDASSAVLRERVIALRGEEGR
ncbi:MFS transporter [Parasalinivibrio latis]|uniref:MFS transporter n=1 Tax=Parasalinivibrio latis TaxID=2952610 RepID=UPI0030E22077